MLNMVHLGCLPADWKDRRPTQNQLRRYQFGTMIRNETYARLAPYFRNSITDV
jgi:hypothetical protein